MRFGQALNGFLLVTLTAAVVGAGALTTGCGSSSSDASASAGALSGDYLATDPGLLREVTFVDATNYTWQRTVCPNADTGCVESGTYVRDESAGTITFTTADGYYSLTLPFSSDASSSTSTTESLHVDDLETTGADGGLASSGGTLTSGNGSLLHSVKIGEQAFSPTTLAAAGDDDGGSGDDGGASLVTAAASIWMPTVVDQQGALVTNGGAVITPNVVSVTWQADPNAGIFERFTESLQGSPYWAATTSEYGVGDLTVGPHVRILSTPPTNMKTETMVTWINAQIAAKNSIWPMPQSAGNTFYEIYVPPSASARYTEENQLGCEAFDGEHASGTYKGTKYAYAIMLQCNGAPATEATSTAAHELVEGAADPFQTKPGYLGFDPAHLAWDLLQNFQDEIADACEDFANIDAMVQGSAGSYHAQRTWSNAAALAGHDPCVPAPAGVAYFNVSPMGMSTVSIKTPSGYYPPNGAENAPKHLQGLGYKILVGGSAVLKIQLNSDVAGTGPWTLKATEGAPQQFGGPTSKVLSLSLDKSSGSAGDIVNLSVKVKSANTKLGGELITIASTMNGVTHYAPILIGN